MSSVFFLVSDLLLAAVRSWVGLALIHWLLMPKSSVGDAPNPDFSPKESSFTESPSAPRQDLLAAALCVGSLLVSRRSFLQASLRGGSLLESWGALCWL